MCKIEDFVIVEEKDGFFYIENKGVNPDDYDSLSTVGVTTVAIQKKGEHEYIKTAFKIKVPVRKFSIGPETESMYECLCENRYIVKMGYYVGDNGEEIEHGEMYTLYIDLKYKTIIELKVRHYLYGEMERFRSYIERVGDNWGFCINYYFGVHHGYDPLYYIKHILPFMMEVQRAVMVARRWKSFVWKRKLKRLSRFYYKWIEIASRPPYGRLFLYDMNQACQEGMVH